MTFAELGLALREAREAKNLSIEDIADRLKLTTSLVRKMEEGDVTALPHAVYTRGFIRGYAAIVGINLEEYQNVIEEFYPLNVPSEHDEKIVLVSSVHQRSKNKRMLLLACIILGGLIFGAYWKLTQPKNIVVPVNNGPVVEQQSSTVVPKVNSTAPNGQVDSKTTTSSVTQERVVKSQDSKTLTVEELTAKELAKGQGLHKPQESATLPATEHAVPSDADQEASTVPAMISTEQAKPQAEALVNVDTKSKTASPEKASPAVTPQKHEMKITAQEDCWMRIVPDGGKASQRVLKKGETATYSFAKNLEMRFGNAGGVSLTYDGKAMPAAGKRGQAVTVTYPLQD